MNTKKCITCGEEKELKMFSFRKDTQKYRNECKLCEKVRKRKHYENNKEKIKLRSYNFYHDNIDSNKAKKKEYREKNKDIISKQRKIYYQKNKETCIQKSRDYYYKNKTRVSKRIASYYIKNKAKINTHKNNRKKNDKIYRLKCEVRNMIYMAFIRKGYSKNHKCKDILGCDVNEFIQYLLQTYKKNYDEEWNGIEKIHIDHIKPLRLAKTKGEVIQLCNYKNLQLLKAEDNLKKSSKINYSLEGV